MKNQEEVMKMQRVKEKLMEEIKIGGNKLKALYQEKS